MRLGLLGQVRRRWCGRGVKLRQRVQLVYQWRYLVVWLDMAGQLAWAWLERLNKETLAPLVAQWRAAGLAGVVWDNAPSHTARRVRPVGLPLVGLPAYAPELNPPERLFEELRRVLEGRVYASLEEKMALAEQHLHAFAADPARLRRLTSWAWIRQNLDLLPEQMISS